jgi:hypothetical protein
MFTRQRSALQFCICLLLALCAWNRTEAANAKTTEKHLLYDAALGIRDYLEYGGHGRRQSRPFH